MAKNFIKIKAWFSDLLTFAHNPCDAVDDRPIKFPLGTIIACPGCHRIQGESLEDIYDGDSVRAAKWDSDCIKPHGLMRCDCGTDYVRRHPFNGASIQLHTTKGWVG